MNKIHTVIWLAIFCCLTGCEQSKEPEFKAPMGPYGLPYRVGSLAGKPVNLGEEVGWLEYEDSPLLRPENRYKGYKQPPRNYKSVVTSFEIIMKYTTGVPLMRYYKAPQAPVKQYDAEQSDPNNKWIYIGVRSGVRFDETGDLTKAYLRYLEDINKKPKDEEDKYNFHFKYFPANINEFGLEKYNPHPIWVEFHGYEDTNDLYIQKDNQNKVITHIICSHSMVDLARTCVMRWTYEPKLRILFNVTFQINNLKDWKLIQNRSEQAIDRLFINKMLD
jgi:hypothetical protein